MPHAAVRTKTSPSPLRRGTGVSTTSKRSGAVIRAWRILRACVGGCRCGQALPVLQLCAMLSRVARRDRKADASHRESMPSDPPRDRRKHATHAMPHMFYVTYVVATSLTTDIQKSHGSIKY